MISVKQPLVIDCVGWLKFFPKPPLLTSFQSGWSRIQLIHFRQPLVYVPEVSNAQHLIMIPVGHHAVDFEVVCESRKYAVSYQEKDYASGCIEVFPSTLPHGFRSHSTVKTMEWIQCYLEPVFLAQIAYESVNPDRVELLLKVKKPDLLIHQIGLALKSSLEQDGAGRSFYADYMATALSAHLLRYYSTRNHRFREYEDGLPKPKLKQAIDYIQAYLGENLSLSEIAHELGMSQYYFCRLFKQSKGISPHKYLIQQRVEKAKHLLRKPGRTVTSIAIECGFANSSHFAKCFYQHTGMSPKQFRK